MQLALLLLVLVCAAMTDAVIYCSSSADDRPGCIFYLNYSKIGRSQFKGKVGLIRLYYLFCLVLKMTKDCLLFTHSYCACSLCCNVM